MQDLDWWTIRSYTVFDPVKARGYLAHCLLKNDLEELLRRKYHGFSYKLPTAVQALMHEAGFERFQWQEYAFPMSNQKFPEIEKIKRMINRLGGGFLPDFMVEEIMTNKRTLIIAGMMPAADLDEFQSLGVFVRRTT